MGEEILVNANTSPLHHSGIENQKTPNQPNPNPFGQREKKKKRGP
jgi:hypothetical protein